MADDREWVKKDVLDYLYSLTAPALVGAFHFLTFVSPTPGGFLIVLRGAFSPNSIHGLGPWTLGWPLPLRWRINSENFVHILLPAVL